MSDDKSNDKPKKNLLSSTLDFEEMDDFLANPSSRSSSDPLSGLVFDAPQTKAPKPEEPRPQSGKPAAAARKPEPPKKSFAPPVFPARQKTPPVVVKQDRFTLYAAIIVLLGLIIISLGIYVTKMGERNSAGLSYIVLPQTIVNVDGLAARVQATIQVSDDDREWLQANKNALSNSFNKAMTSLDLEELRNPDGIVAAQSELKILLNRDLKTDKVEAVLLTELLVQEQ